MDILNFLLAMELKTMLLFSFFCLSVTIPRVEVKTCGKASLLNFPTDLTTMLRCYVSRMTSLTFLRL